MRPFHAFAIRCWAAGCVGCLFCWAGSASGSVIGTDAAITTTVQEMLDGAPASVTTDQSARLPDGSNLPLVSTSNLQSTDLEENLIATGQAFAGFAAPGLTNPDNPREFTLEAAAFANGDMVSYSVNVNATESRTLVFTTPGNPLAEPEFGFGLGNTRLVESRVFLSGAIVFWSTQAGLSLENMLGEVNLSVTRQDTGATLFTTSLSVAGQNSATVSPSANGPIQFSTVTIDDLRGESVDEASLAVLEQIESNGSLVVLAIPEQEHAYTYTVTADQSFVLRADLNALARNVPGGTGVAVTLGGPFENLADFMAQGLADVDGGGVERSINAITASRKIGLVQQSSDPGATFGRLCGALGAETIPVVALGLFATLARRRR